MQSTIENTHRRPRLTFIVEGDTIGELRAKVIQALDLQLGLKAEQAAAHVEALQAEDTATAEIPEKAEKAVSESTEKLDAAQAQMQTDAIEAVAEKVKAKPRASRKKAEPAATTVVSDFAKEIEAQADAEDEAPKKLTADAVKAAFDQYVNRFGVAAAQEDGPQLLDRVFGVGVIRRVRDVPTDDQGKLGRIIAAVEGAILTNEFKRSAVQ